MRDQKRAGTMLAYVQWVVNVLVGVVYTPIMLRCLGPNEYGVYSVATAVISFLAMLDLGFGQTLVRFNVDYRARGEEERAERCSGAFFLMYLVLGVVALVICTVLSNHFLPALFGKKFTAEELDILRRVLSILIINLAASFPLSVFSSLITAHERFAFGKLVAILNTVLTYGGILVVLMRGYRSVAMATVTTVVSIALKLFMAWYCLRRMKVRIRFARPEWDMLRSIFAFSFFVFLNILIDQLYASTDKFVLGAVCGTAAVTVYTVGVQFNGYFQQLSTAVSGVFMPQVTRMYAEGAGGKEYSPLFIRIGRLQFVLLSFVLAGFAAFGRQFIALLSAGELDSRGVTQAFVIALIIMVPGVVPLSQNIGISILQAMNRHRFRSLAYLVLALTNVAISIPLAMRWAGVGAAIGTTLAYFAGQYAMMNWFYWKKIGLDIPGYWRTVGSVALRTIPMALPAIAINLLLPGGGWMRLILRCVIFTVVYLPYGWFVIFDQYEKSLIRSVLRRLHLVH